MQRRVGQQDADASVLAQIREAARPGGAPLFQKHDGPAGALQQRGLLAGNAAELPGGVQIAAQNGQRLFLPVFAAAQAAHRGLVQRAAGQVDAACALHRHNAPGGQRLLGQRDGVAG